jgi:hypothetical protein
MVQQDLAQDQVLHRKLVDHHRHGSGS